MDHVWLGIFWVLYFILHSLMALLFVKNFFYSIGMRPQTYRFIFVAIATLTLIALVIFSSTIDSNYIFYPNNIIKFTGLLLAGWGVIIAKIAFKSYDARAFLGLGSLNPEDEFKTDGLLKRVRHPLYSGSILLIVGYFLFNPKLSALISASMMIVYFLVGIQFEERKLVKVFGDKYSEYKKKTPMLIPRFWK